jgi:hypothetical protein
MGCELFLPLNIGVLGMLRPFPPDLFWSGTWSFGLALWDIVLARLILVQFARHHARLRTALRVQCRRFQRVLSIYEACKLTLLYSSKALSCRSSSRSDPRPIAAQLSLQPCPRSTKGLAKEIYTCSFPFPRRWCQQLLLIESWTQPTADMGASVLLPLYIFPSAGAWDPVYDMSATPAPHGPPRLEVVV